MAVRWFIYLAVNWTLISHLLSLCLFICVSWFWFSVPHQNYFFYFFQQNIKKHKNSSSLFLNNKKLIIVSSHDWGGIFFSFLSGFLSEVNHLAEVWWACAGTADNRFRFASFATPSVCTKRFFLSISTVCVRLTIKTAINIVIVGIYLYLILFVFRFFWKILVFLLNDSKLEHKKILFLIFWVVWWCIVVFFGKCYAVIIFGFTITFTNLCKKSKISRKGWTDIIFLEIWTQINISNYFYLTSNCDISSLYKIWKSW